GFPETGINAIFRDHEGAIWIGTRVGLWRWQSGRTETFLTDPPAEIYSITENSKQQIVVASNSRHPILYLSGGKPQSLEMPASDLSIPARLVMGHSDGSIWIGSFSGVARVNNGQVQRLTSHQGLSGSAVQALLEE